MDIKLTTATGKASSKSVEVSEDNFGREFNEALIHQVVTAYLAAGRSGTRGTKTRAEVSGGGIKPWKQKGTGRARAGSTRSPLWRTGGHTFALRPQDHSQKVNKKMYRSAMRSILSEMVRQDRLAIVDKLDISEFKTKALLQMLTAMDFSTGLIVTEAIDEKLSKSARNLRNVNVLTAADINPVSLVSSDKVLMTVAAVKQIEEMLA